MLNLEKKYILANSWKVKKKLTIDHIKLNVYIECKCNKILIKWMNKLSKWPKKLRTWQ